MKAPLARLAYLFAVLIVASYALIALRGPNGIPGLLEKRREVQNLEKKNAELSRQNERMMQRIKRLGEDPAEQERVIKERLKLFHPGEKVYIFEDPKK